MGVTVKNEMLKGNPPEHPNTIEFGIYYQALLDRQSESLEPQPKIVNELDDEDEVEPEPQPEPRFELDLEKDPEWELGDDFRSRLEAEDASEDEAPLKQFRRTHGNQKLRFHFLSTMISFPLCY